MVRTNRITTGTNDASCKSEAQFALATIKPGPTKPWKTLRTSFLVTNLNCGMRLVIDGRYLGLGPSGIGSYIRALIARLPDLAPDIPFRIWVAGDSSNLDSVAQRVQLHRVTSRPNSLITLVGPWALINLSQTIYFIVQRTFSALDCRVQALSRCTT